MARCRLKVFSCEESRPWNDEYKERNLPSSPFFLFVFFFLSSQHSSRRVNAIHQKQPKGARPKINSGGAWVLSFLFHFGYNYDSLFIHDEYQFLYLKNDSKAIADLFPVRQFRLHLSKLDEKFAMWLTVLTPAPNIYPDRSIKYFVVFTVAIFLLLSESPAQGNLGQIIIRLIVS